MKLEEKSDKLQNILKKMGSCLVAYSGGVDSTFLLKTASEVLGDKVAAATARSETYPSWEYKQAKKLAERLKIKHITIFSEELQNKNFSSNPPQRCYYCKKELFGKLKLEAQKRGLKYVVDGANLDDAGDFRPGLKAAEEMAVRSPLMEAELSKQDIRELSKRMGLSTWSKPSFACLASRFPYGEEITEKKLNMTDKAEKFLQDNGIKQVRVRYHNNLARIEVPPSFIKKFLDEDFRERVVEKFEEVGYSYVSLDLKGYRRGSMNEVLKEEQRWT